MSDCALVEGIPHLIVGSECESFCADKSLRTSEVHLLSVGVMLLSLDTSLISKITVSFYRGTAGLVACMRGFSLVSH